MSISTEHFPLIVDIPTKILCTVFEAHVLKMEVMLYGREEPLAVAYDTSSVALTLTPHASYNGGNITCKAHTTANLQFENYIMIWVEGIDLKLAYMML